jgi:membrane-associated phospholipid phosphatase
MDSRPPNIPPNDPWPPANCPGDPCKKDRQECCVRSNIPDTGEPNGDEAAHPHGEVGYRKGLPHNAATGLPDPGPYDHYRKVLASNTRGAPPATAPFTFEDIVLCLGRKLVNPQSGLASDQELDPHAYTMPPAPAFNSRQMHAEAIELYWMALLRDVPFTRYAEDPTVDHAANDLTGLGLDYTGPRLGPSPGRITPDLLFRGCEPGSRIGPYVSQFLLKTIPSGSIMIPQRIRTAVPRVDYMTRWNAWLDSQNGTPIRSLGALDGTVRYIRSIRDLTAYVHFDINYEEYLHAYFILLGMNAPFDEGNPYKTSCEPNKSRTQIGMGTFGPPHVTALLAEVSTRALKAAWYQKWFIHRRIRPEEYGGLIDKNLFGAGALQSNAALVEAHKRWGSYLLPQAFPEGCPTHPSYPSGHATVAGACVTILKAFMEECTPIPEPMEATDDGLELVPYRGDDATRITVGGELNKLATNIAIARDMAGVHWQTDYTAGLRLGEKIAVGLLLKQLRDYYEDYFFTFTDFDGCRWRISCHGREPIVRIHPKDCGKICYPDKEPEREPRDLREEAVSPPGRTAQ